MALKLVVQPCLALPTFHLFNAAVRGTFCVSIASSPSASLHDCVKHFRVVHLPHFNSSMLSHSDWGLQFGEARQAGFEWAGSRDRCSGGGSFPGHLLSPPVVRTASSIDQQPTAAVLCML